MLHHFRIGFLIAVFFLISGTTTILAFPLLGQGDLKGVMRERLFEKLQLLSEDDRINVIIKYESPLSKDQRDFLKKNGAIAYEYSLYEAVAVTLPKRILEGLSREDRKIAWIDYDFPVRTFLDTAIINIQADQVFTQYGITGKGVKIAVIDTGVDKNHPALRNKIVSQVDFTGEGNGDKNGHGTHVAGVIAADQTPYRGVAAGAQIFDVKVLNEQGTGEASDIIAGIEWAVEHEADIASLSLGGKIAECDGSDALSVAVDAAYDRGIFVVVAAGNDGPLQQTVATPACAKKAFTVGAVNDMNQVALFSSRGPTTDNRVKPDIFAPGVGITSTFIGGGFNTLSGTSQATPFVSGVAALLLEETPKLTPENLKSIIVETSISLPRPFVNTQDQGIVQALASLQKLPPEKPISPIQEEKISHENNDALNDVSPVNEEENELKDTQENVLLSGFYDAEPSFDQARAEVTLCLRSASSDAARKEACVAEFLVRQREIQASRFLPEVKEELDMLQANAQEEAVFLSKNQNLSDQTIARALNDLKKIAVYLFSKTSIAQLENLLQTYHTIFSEGSDESVRETLLLLESDIENNIAVSRASKFLDALLDFRDVDDNVWFFLFVHSLGKKGCVSGFETVDGQSTGEFRPSNSLTVAEALKISIECSGNEKATSGTTSVLKAQGHWSEGYFLTAEKLGLSPNTDEDPDRPITRGETVSLIFATFQFVPINGVEHVFSDVPTDFSEAPYIESAREYGIVSGDSGMNTFRPFDTLNRAEMSKIIIQALSIGDSGLEN